MFFFFSFNPYIAIIGDLKDSKQVKEREVTQQKLRSTLQTINEKYAADIASKFTITLGDEFQGLLSSGENIMAILLEIEQHIYPVRIRFGIGIGDITTDINPELAIGADGPAYYDARSAVEYLKQNEKRKQSTPADIRIESNTEAQSTIDLLNTIFTLMATLKGTWTSRQRQIIGDLLKHSDSQSDVAGRLDIQQSTVQKSLVSGNFYSYKEALSTIERVLGEIRREND